MDGFRQLFASFLILLIEGKLNDGQVEAIDAELRELSDTRGIGRLTDVQDLTD